MINRDFYAFCRDQRKIEPDLEKREALVDVYRYMWECGVTKGGVAHYIAARIDQISNGERSSSKIDISQAKQQTCQAQIDAYQWLLGVFTSQKNEEAGNEPTLWR